MKKGYLMLLFACLFAVPAFGLCKHENYIGDNDVTGWMYSYYSSWTPGSAPSGGSENENFYIGRVRPLKRFTNTATQVIQDGTTAVTRRANRGLLWWCPINEGTWTSLPRYNFDSEAFSMWSYVTIHGNWTQGFLRQPGAFADVCHKNGVRTACVASIPWAQTLSSTDAGHGQNFKALINGGANKLMSLLAYYGIDGLGFNSEQEWGDVRNGMKSLLAACHSIKGNFDMTDRLHFDFYSLNNCLTSSGGNMQDFSDFWPSANGFFLNYNWGSTLLNNSETVAGSKSFDVYAGMDMQGRSSADWTSLNNYNISIGIWGAHNKCMPYEGATEDGSTKDAIQKCYLRKTEQLFTGGTRNPVNDKTISNVLCSGNSSFFGVSKLMAAKSALSWNKDLNGYFPFISYLNLGNGKFFNNEGVTTYDNEWYNIGMQDYLPTWRWWITDDYMARSTGNVPSDTHAEFTYEDAWFGGSCLKLTFDNSVSGWRYIQLFKTQFPIADANYTLRVRYKALSGSANMQYTMSKVGEESTVITQAMGTMKAGTGEWQVIEKGVPTNIVGSTMAQLGMRFNNIVDGTEILIGEIALVKNGVTYSPVAPTLDSSKTKILKTTSRGVDFKVIWNCSYSGSKKAYEPVYNDEVDTWYFEIWGQQNGGEPQLVTTTTSWAAYAVEVPIVLNGTMTFRAGVRAVAPDGVTKSSIVWSNYMSISDITIIEGFSVDKPVIKVGETFTVSFDDPLHGAATSWKVYNAKDNTVVYSTTGGTSFSTSLAATGLYDVEVTYKNQNGATVTDKERGMIQVSGDEVGAMPQIYTLTTDKESNGNEIGADEVVTLSYTGRAADGTTSQALRLQEKPFCVRCSDFFNAAGFGNTQPITISFWFNPLQFIDAGDSNGNTGFGDNGTQMLNIRKPTDRYPTSEWGYMWSGIHNGGNDYWVNILKASQTAGANYTTMTQNFVIPTANWTHIAISVVGSSTSSKDVELYVNGRKVSDAVQGKATVATLSSSHFIFMGGTAAFRSAFDGYIDEFQIWKKQFTESTINQTMVHYNDGEVPSELVCYWDFEQDATSDNRLISRGSLSKEVYAVVGNTWRCVQGDGDGITGSDPMVESNRMAPLFGAGTPFLAGKYEVKTLPSWKFEGVATPGAVIGDGVGGSTTVSWATMENAPYKCTLTLENSWGKDVKSVTMFDACVKLDEAGQIVEDLSVYPNPFTESVHVRFIEAGNYELDVFTLSGQLVQTKQLNVQNYEAVGINLNTAEQGMYLVRLKKEGKVIKSFKLEKR